MQEVAKLSIKRRLTLFVALAAVGGLLFVPFVLASSQAQEQDSTVLTWLAFTLGAAAITALAAWGGLRLADKAALPMPLLRSWEKSEDADRVVATKVVITALGTGATVGLLAALTANAVGVPDNPGSFLERIATTLFAATVPEVLVHLLVMSGLVVLLKRPWPAIVLSSLVFVVLFHGNLVEDSIVLTVFLAIFNFGFGTLTGWFYLRYGFESAVLAHAAGHIIVLGIN